MSRGSPDASPSPRARRAREHLLEALRVGGSASRSQLAARTGLAASSVAATAAALLAAGVIVERPIERSGRGRRAGILSLAPGGDLFVVGIDIGHRHVAVALADHDGRILVQQRANMDVDHRARATLDLSATLTRDVAAEAGMTVDEITAVAACLPTTLDSETDEAAGGSWRGVTAPDNELSVRLGRPVTLVNDADAGLLGEVRFGAARGVEDVLYVKASHGVGAAFQLDGRPYHGSGGLAGEIGHIRVPSSALSPDAPWCRCGNQGCLETAVSVDVLDERLARARMSPAAGPSQLDTIEKRMLLEAGRTLGRVLADLVTALNPAVVVIGGELSVRGDSTGEPPLLVGVREAVSRYALPIIATSLEVRAGALGRDAELRGVLSLGLDTAAASAILG